ncbi:hypothetical protein NQ857_16620 [Acinetobacter baumannii]|nr:hypothetical protein [Acinetobacter baumannii]
MKEKIDKQLILIFILCGLALLFYFKANDDPIWPYLKGTWFESSFYKWDTGSSLVRDLCIGILVSTVFWVFNVYLPEKRDRKRKLSRLNRALKLILEAKNGNPFGWDKHYIYCNPLDYSDIADIQELTQSINSGKIYNTLAEKAFYELCNESYEMFRILSIAANEISAEHGALWDSMTSNISQIGKFHPDYFEKIQKSGWKLGDEPIDFSEGLFKLNMIELLEKMEQWIKNDF